MGGGDAKVDAVKVVVDIEERRRHNRGRRNGNGRVDAKVDAVKPSEPRRGWVCLHARDERTHRCCQYRTYKVESPNHALASKEPAEKVSTMVAARGAVG
jgi:hypothetical protein